MTQNTVLEMIGIKKEFHGVKALDQVDFSAGKAEIHALVGENGAGKSTLMKILSGVYSCSTYDGTLKLYGKEKKFYKPKDAEEAGIVIIHQELMLLDELSVAENIFLGHLDNKCSLVNWKTVYERAQNVLKQLDVEIDVRMKVKNLGVGHKQLVEIAKALSLQSKILILDEPTAALTESETARLFGVLKELRKKGMTLIYISHRMAEVFELADTISVLRDGRLIATENRQSLSHQKVVSMMVGREICAMYPVICVKPGKELLKIEDYSVNGTEKTAQVLVKNANLSLKAGEIVGIFGLLGSGRTELVSSIFGAYRKKGIGKIYINSSPVNIKDPKQAIRYGLAFVTEDRKQNGLILNAGVAQNISLATLKTVSKKGILYRQAENKLADRQIKNLSIKTAGIGVDASKLSGGNQQKVVLGKWLSTKPDILILDEPTRGVDVGAKSEIYQIIRDLADSGVGIIMVSSDLPEIIGMSNRVYVMHQGKIVGEFDRADLTEELIMQYATGIYN